MDNVNELLRVSRSTIKALGLVGKTVIKVNEDALLDASDIIKNHSKVVTVGVKNTNQISRRYLKQLIETKKYVWHTIDAMADGGRAVDVELTNPITLKPMTGSSSATAINVLLGVNDIGIGTDGGGSVLAPALSLNLYSIMAKGMGLKGSIERISTDGICFTPGIGIISHSLDNAEEAITSMLGIGKKDINIGDLNMAVCKSGNIILPDGIDMREKLRLALYILKEKNISVTEVELPDFKDRNTSISEVKKLFNDFDIIMTYEGPVDLVGVGDSVFGTLGNMAKRSQNMAGKYMVKIANMVDATAVTVPSDEAACGIVITAKPGMDAGLKSIMVAKELEGLYKLPGLYYDYFREGYLRRKNDLIFSLEGV